MKKFTLIGLCFMLIFSCRTDEFTETLNPPVFVESHLSGVVMDINKHPVTNAIVSVSNKITETDNNGVFNFRNIELSTDGSLVKIKKSGYFDGLFFANGKPGKQSYLEAVLIERQPQEFESGTGGIITMNGGASVAFEPNSIVTGGGSDYSGVVEVSVHYYDPGSDETAFSMPGDLRGRDQNSNQVQLVTYGMMAVELQSPSGVKLQLAPQSIATLKFPINQNSDVLKYNDIPMWYMDEESGTWIEEGLATIEGDNLVGEVSHFSFWNCDVPFPLVNITGSLVSEEGSPLAFQRVLIKDNNNNISRSGSTNESGVFSGKVPADVDLSMFHYACDGASALVKIGILTSDTDLGPVTVNTENSISLSATLQDCEMQAITHGYVKISSPNITKIINTNEVGKLDYTFFHCNETDVFLEAFDYKSAIVSETKIINTSETEQDLETIYLCDSMLGEYIRYTINGVPHGMPLDQVSVYFADDRMLYIYADHEFDPAVLPSTLVIRYDVTTGIAQYWARGYTSNGDPLESSGDDLEVQASAIGGINSEVFMTFDNGEFKGELNVFIDDVVESGTIRVKVWHDDNENGIQDPGEPPVVGKRISLLYLSWHAGLSNAGYSYYPQHFTFATSEWSNGDGILEFTGVFTELESRLTYFAEIGETLTLENAGNDDSIDSDFYDRFNASSNGKKQYNTDDFILDSGGQKTDFGLGIKQ